MQQYPSKLLQIAVDEFASLPGIGRKTALRLVLHMLKQEESKVSGFASAIERLRREVRFCSHCHNICDAELCEICIDKTRDKSLICVVEDVRDVLAIENTGQFRGVYHVLGGKISPMDGIGPSDLQINTLIDKISKSDIQEVILALSATMEGDTTNFYISKKLSAFSVKISTIARGIGIGDELEYADEITLGRSILNRVPYQIQISG
jgi:recombination protein RecR